MACKGKAVKAKPVDLGGSRVVVLRTADGYVSNFNTTFGIIVVGPRKEASRVFLSDAVDIIRDVGRFGVHRLWCEPADGPTES